MLKPELWVQRISGDDVVREVLEQVPTPSAEEALRVPEWDQAWPRQLEPGL